MEREFFVGVDLGQIRDPTAIAVLERKEVQGEFDWVYRAYRKEIELAVRNVHRVPLGTPYAEVAARVCRVTNHPDLRDRCELAVDATGVGRPVVETIREEGPGCTMLPVMITCGAKETRVDGDYHVPKRDLITRVQILFQKGLLKIAAKLPEAEELVKELLEMRVTITPAGNEQFAAREGKHDDLVLAVALACWACEKRWSKPPEGLDAYILRTGVSAWERGMREELKTMEKRRAWLLR